MARFSSKEPIPRNEQIELITHEREALSQAERRKHVDEELYDDEATLRSWLRFEFNWEACTPIKDVELDQHIKSATVLNGFGKEVTKYYFDWNNFWISRGVNNGRPNQ